MRSVKMEIKKISIGKSNCYFIIDRGKAWLVDAGVREDPSKILKTMEMHQLTPDKLDAVIVTHTHSDHVKGLAHLKSYTGAAVIVHQDEADFLKDGHTPIPAGTGPFSRFIVRIGRAASDASLAGYRSVTPDITINDRTDISSRGIPAYLLPTPGHTAGSISLIVEGTHAFVGDALFHLLPWKIYPPFANDQNTLIRSWKALLDTGCIWFYPTHGNRISRKLLERRYKGVSV